MTLQIDMDMPIKCMRCPFVTARGCLLIRKKCVRNTDLGHAYSEQLADERPSYCPLKEVK